MRYVVTGAAGFIGSHLRDALEASGHDVVAVDSLTDYYDPARKLDNVGGRQLLELDLAQTDIDALVDGADGVFHLAGQPGVRSSFGPDFELYVRRNVLASGRVFEAAARAGLRVVYASSSSIYGDAETYPTAGGRPRARSRPTASRSSPASTSRTHTAVRAVWRRSGCATSPFSARGSARHGLHAAPGGARGRRLVRALRRYVRSFTYVDDAVAATIAAMERGHAGASTTSAAARRPRCRETIALAERIAGRELKLELQGSVAGDARRTRADGAKAARELGWQPTTTLEQGLRAQWEWVAGRVAAR